jgi:hypothetical protein
MSVSKERAQMDLDTSIDRIAWRVAGSLFVVAAMLGCLLLATPAGANFEDYGLESTSALLSTPQAGSHADFEPRFNIIGNPNAPSPGGNESWANTREVVTELPPGLLGNPSAFPACSAQTFIGQTSTIEFGFGEHMCPRDTQVGLVSPGLTGVIAFPPGGNYKTPLYNLEAPGGEGGVVARLGFVVFGYPIFIDIKIDPKRDDALTATVTNVNALVPFAGAYTTLWGVPTDASHDLQRMTWVEARYCEGPCSEEVENPVTHEIEFKVVPRPSGLPPTPFMDNPTSCGPVEVGTALTSYQRPEGADFDIQPLGSGLIEDCEAVPFEPTMSLEPTSRSAAASSGLDASLHIPQEGLTDPETPATAHVKEAKVTLPRGFSVNASAADGLGSCSPAQIGLDRNERQIVDYGTHGAPVSLSFNGHSTAELPHLASAAEVQSALEALPGIGTGNVAVGGRAGGPWTVDFRGALAGQDVPAIGGTNSELQQLALGAFGGTFKLDFEGEETTSLPFNASAEEAQGALEALSGIGAGNVEVTVRGGVESPIFRLAFKGDLAQIDVPAITIDDSSLEGGFAGVHEDTLAQGASPVKTDTVQRGGEIRFNGENPTCPESSKVATGEIHTPVLGEPLKASFYLAKQQDNPYNSLFAGYLVAKGAGALIKVPARIDVDPNTGQVTTTFTQNPQQPFEDLELHFKGGNRGLITTPDKCGTYASEYELTPWSGTEPVKGQSEFTLDENCGAKPFAPGFHAGSETALAGSFTTFATQVTNEPGAPDLTRISVDLPEGLAAKLAGVSTCPDSALASLPTAAGTGAAQLTSPSCPANSQIGTVQAGAGSGSPFYVKTGKAYLAGPYKGAPLSLAVLTPAVAGPFDLGNVLVRVPVSLDRKTARADAVSDEIPTSLQGIPLDLRDVRVLLDRQGFALNPTSCEAEQANGVIEGTGGASANVSDRFQVGECAALGFKPKLALKLKGGTKRGDHPALTAVFRPRPGDANTSYVQVALPKSEFLDQGHIGTVCTRVQFDADQCPKASIYGSVTASTPLLDQPLKGNVYLRSSSNELPDLVMDLRGPASQPIHLEADGRIDSVKGGIRTTFQFVPDAPITKVTLKMQGAKKGLLQNSRDICASTFKANAAFAAHNGRTLAAQPEMQARCKGAARKGKGQAKHHG